MKIEVVLGDYEDGQDCSAVDYDYDAGLKAEMHVSVELPAGIKTPAELRNALEKALLAGDFTIEANVDDQITNTEDV